MDTNTASTPLQRVKNLFQPKKATVAPMASQTATITSNFGRQQGETYVAFGKRICSITLGSQTSLAASLQRVFFSEKQAQINDKALQAKKKQEIQNKITNIDSDIKAKQSSIDNSKIKIDNLNNKVSNLKADLEQAKIKNGEVNKSNQTKLYIGSVILTILTVYLFIFYSSTFYSAFFRDFASGNITVGTAMFDAQALPQSLNEGFGQLLFICTAPIIFMGLGFALHFFSIQTGKVKYLKSGAILLITFVFDCILAYLIAKKIYQVEELMSLSPMPPFSVSEAIVDVNVWAVIFCGFIVYIIWGIVFDLTITAYEGLRSNKAEIARIEAALDNLSNQITTEQQAIVNTQAQIDILTNDKKKLEVSLNENVFFDTNIIKQALTDFHSGWIATMAFLGKSQTEQNEDQNTNQTTISTLFPNTQSK